MMTEKPIIEIKKLNIQLAGHYIHKDLDLSIKKGEILGIVGASGSGKTTLFREMLMLQRPNSGSIQIFGKELTTADTETLLNIQCRWGVLFQQNALFSSLTVLENTAFPLYERTSLDKNTCEQLALLKILLVGLPLDAAQKYPAELSGGMQKKAALARAIILDPELLFLDEPTAGLDPNSAAELDELILTLQSTMGLTVIIITHDLDTLWKITNRVAFLGEGKVLCIDAVANLAKNENKLIQEFFQGPRGRVAKDIHEEQ